MTKITVITYVHESHQKWIPFWLSQISNQEFQEFDILFVAHNWGVRSRTQEKINRDEFERLLDSPEWSNRIRFMSYWSAPVIGKVIDFAASKVETEWLAHHDIDDVIHPKRLLLQSDFLDANPEVDFLNARCMGFYGEEPLSNDLYYHDKSSELLEYLTDPNLQTNQQIKECFAKQYNCLSHGLMIYKPDVLESLGGFSKSDVKIDGISPDWATWQKAINSGFIFHRLPELLMYWRLDSSAIRL